MSRAHIRDVDAGWMSWLREASKFTGLSTKSLFVEYSQSSEMFQLSLNHMTTKVVRDWPFCHNTQHPMSSYDIAAARLRYLDRYPLTADEKCQQTYVDSLLRIDQAQVRLRRGNALLCPKCAEKDKMIAKLRNLLTEKDLKDYKRFDRHVIKAIFHRYFILNGVSKTARNDVRTTIEKAMQEELGMDEVLPSTCDVWRDFLQHTLGASSADSLPIRCIKRRSPLPLGYCDVE